MKRLSPKRIELNRMKPHLVKAYKVGHSLRTIASWHSTSAGTVRSILIEEGIQMRKPGRSRKEK
jgi:hypothetical protein